MSDFSMGLIFRLEDLPAFCADHLCKAWVANTSLARERAPGHVVCMYVSTSS